MLASYAETFGYELIVIEKERYHNREIGSTYAKEMLKEGKWKWCLIFRAIRMN